MKQDEIRRTLIDGTIHVIARDGLDKATTKQIGLATTTNEVYIYRCFVDKEDMLARTFDSLDEELANKVMQYLPIMYKKEMVYEMRCRFFFFEVWKFLLGNRDKCLAYVRYYYSPYFFKCSADSHKNRFAPTVDKFRDAFKEEADVWMILNHILNVMLDFAVKVHNGQMSDSDDYSEHIFRVIYRSIEQYFRTPKEIVS
ncbi:MAG: TetR/AcrR family transcriptional regulator [Clostridia bacterium]|nr:TetR/AcrR family transcriptional regulator [Clostridia bacterium]